MDNFNVQINDRVNEGWQKRIKNFLTVPRIIFLILGIILLAELIYAFRVLTASGPLPPIASTQKADIQKVPGKISLVSPKTSYKVNETVSVSVMIDSGDQAVDGADLIVRFDQKVLEATPGGLVKGIVFDEYPLLSVEPGVIAISGVSNLAGGFKGRGQFAVLNLRAKAAGTTPLTIDFNAGATTDSNLVEAATSKDILGVVDNLSLEIR